MAPRSSPDFDINRAKARMRALGPFWRRVIPLAIALGLVALGVSGAYVVGPGEQAVVRTLGRESGKAGPGLHYALPLIQRKDIVNIGQVRRIEVGLRGQQRVPDAHGRRFLGSILSIIDGRSGPD